MNKQPNTKLETVLNIKKTLVDERPYSFEDCIVWSRLKFEKVRMVQIISRHQSSSLS